MPNVMAALPYIGGPSLFQRVSRLCSVTAPHSNIGRQPNCDVEQRAQPIFGRAAITFRIGPHSSWKYFYQEYQNPFTRVKVIANQRWDVLVNVNSCYRPSVCLLSVVCL